MVHPDREREVHHIEHGRSSGPSVTAIVGIVAVVVVVLFLFGGRLFDRGGEVAVEPGAQQQETPAVQEPAGGPVTAPEATAPAPEAPAAPPAPPAQ